MISVGTLLRQRSKSDAWDVQVLEKLGGGAFWFDRSFPVLHHCMLHAQPPQNRDWGKWHLLLTLPERNVCLKYMLGSLVRVIATVSACRFLAAQLSIVCYSMLMLLFMLAPQAVRPDVRHT